MTKRVAEAVNCTCGYRGPAIDVAGRLVCPICRTPAMAATPTRVEPSAAAPPASSRSPTPVAVPQTLRIPCPRGHLLKAGAHMLGQQVVCPECNEMFLLRESDSVEGRRREEQVRRAAEERIARVWLVRSVWAAAIIVAGLVGMVAFSFARRVPGQRPGDPPSVPDPAARTE